MLVLAGAQLARDQRQPVPLSTVINAAVSEVEDYRRVEIAGLPECLVIGAAAGGVIHLFAELIDNALRYSPPTTVVRISAARGGDAGVLLRIADSGLGMNDADQRIANTRLQAGGEVTPDNARHMGLFVVGRKVNGNSRFRHPPRRPPSTLSARPSDNTKPRPSR